MLFVAFVVFGTIFGVAEAAIGDKCAEPITNGSKCEYRTHVGEQLKFWDQNDSASICTTLTSSLLDCQQLCSANDKCKAIHFCDDCPKFNCRLLAKKKADGFELVEWLSHVDYHEKIECFSVKI